MSFDDYNDLCTECEFHNKCHRNGHIDYAKVENCQIDAFGHNGISAEQIESIRQKPKEKVRVLLI
jgi:hypothetical protein